MVFRILKKCSMKGLRLQCITLKFKVTVYNIEVLGCSNVINSLKLSSPSSCQV